MTNIPLRLASGEPGRATAMTKPARTLWRAVAATALIACVSFPAHAAAPPGPALPTGAGGQTMVMEFIDTNIDHVLRLFSRGAGVTIVKSDQVSGNLTVIAPEPVPLDVAFQILDEVLAVRGYAIIRTPTGSYKVLPREDAMQSALPVQFGARPEDVPASEGLITQVIPLTNLSSNDVITQIQGMLSSTARVVPTSINSIIISDSAANIQQVLTVIADMENQLSGGIRVFPLQWYDAQEMAQLVNDYILGRGAGALRAAQLPWEQRAARVATPAVRIAARPAATAPLPGTASAGPEFCHPDTRANRLIVLATPLHLSQIEDLVAQLDCRVSLRDSFFVYPAQNLMASELAQMVAPLVDAQVNVIAPGTLRTPGRLAADLGQGVSQQLGQRPVTGGAIRRLGSASLAPAMRTPSAAALEVEPLAGSRQSADASAPLVVAQAAPGEGPPTEIQVAPQPGLPAGSVVTIFTEAEETAPLTSATKALIVADDNSNTVLISAPPEQLDLLQQMLEKLDVLPPQVHIRAIIAEVALTRDTSLGFQWNRLPLLEPYGGAFAGEFTTNFAVGASGDDVTTTPLGLFGQISADDFDAVLTALTTDSHVRILSTPSIFTSNNQEATIDVSKGIPFPRSTVEYQTGTGATSTQVEYQSVGIILTVIPRVTQGDMVRMDVAVRSDELGESIDVAGQGYPTTNQRKANATLSVRNGYTVVLGGLMRDTIRRSAFKVPLLGDIPLLGSLFRSTNSKREKSELLVFLTPRVVRTPAEAARVTDQEKSRLPEVPRSLQAPASGSAPTP